MARNYRLYSDIDAIFSPHPVSGDLTTRKDEAAIKFAVKNLVLTRNFERPFNSDIGSQLYNFLFEPLDDTTIILMKQAVIKAVTDHEPRVDLVSVDILPSPDKNEVAVSIIFKIKNTEKPLNITLTLDRTR